MKTEILKIDSINPDMYKIYVASATIKKKGTVIFPTETVYGLGADAFSSEACKKIFIAKKRAMDNPLIVHIASLKDLELVASNVSSTIIDKLKKLWPGPLTVILKKNSKIPDTVSGGLSTVAVRMPAHPVALALIEDSNTPIAAPSANLSTKPSIVTGIDAISEMYGRVDVIIDSSHTFFGLESTIINLTGEIPAIVRPGIFTYEELKPYFDNIVISNTARGINEETIAIAPGMKYRHYAPDKSLYMVKNDSLYEAIFNSELSNELIAVCSTEMSKKIKGRKILLGSERNLYDVALHLFDSLRVIDELHGRLAIIQSFNEGGIGLAIMNRIRKASSGNVIESFEQFKKIIEASDF
ncbi:MAG: L-threonylcarbamoyladenylate synthase [Candidatus Thermoplasmatota archaeon]|nr:L-threonylcarbamoyladenylate synthase [Candidatus Thermoplasmatota archaeon]MCL5962839.1 L-threonylcarbamoyladenylate synthase [Candidatus Thermoplasmatota archaeon]